MWGREWTVDDVMPITLGIGRALDRALRNLLEILEEPDHEYIRYFRVIYPKWLAFKNPRKSRQIYSQRQYRFNFSQERRTLKSLGWRICALRANTD